LTTLSARVAATGVGSGDVVIAFAVGPSSSLVGSALVTVTQVVLTVTVTSSNGANPDTLYTTTRTRQFNAAAADTNGNNIPGALFTWVSTVPAAATVDATGVVTAVADGTSSIQATSGTKTGSRNMLVRRFAQTFTLAPPSATISTAGGTQLFTGVAQDSVGTNLTISWSSANTGVFTVSPASGTSTTATGTGNGSANVVMTAGTRTNQALVTTTNQLATTAAVSVGNDFFKSGRNNTQNPAVDTIAVGGTVTWTWLANGVIQHSVESTGAPSFVSSAIQTAAGSTYVRTFNTAGTYTYDCAVHGSTMTGRIVVR
jgi:plastocyanin